jgi:pantoate--beta-alanine ligase
LDSKSATPHDLAFVPTMGALHAGHESLIRLARRYSDEVVVSIFVNPLQFDNPDDLAKYPRTLESDTQKAIAAGATRVWAPTYAEIYPGSIDAVKAGKVGTIFEGASRPGHFDGMLTVVKRLFALVQPRWAIFGEKDYQQLFLVREMVRDLALPVEIVPAPLVREADGLALSSRNTRLSSMGHAQALVISRALREASAQSDLNNARAKLRDVLSSEPGFHLDYAEIIDESTFALATLRSHSFRAIVAGWVEGVRLLDNTALSFPSSSGRDIQ